MAKSVEAKKSKLNHRDRTKELILVLSSIAVAVSLIFSYAGGYYSSAHEMSSEYIIFATVFYTASHLFCEKGYNCAFSNMTFPEFQKQELQKYQDQIDWTREKADKWNSVSSQILWVALVLNIISAYMVIKSKQKN